jgi:hypothetical protein
VGREDDLRLIDREAVTDELAEFVGGKGLVADLAALVEAGLIVERQGIAATRFAPSADQAQGE